PWPASSFRWRWRALATTRPSPRGCLSPWSPTWSASLHFWAWPRCGCAKAGWLASRRYATVGVAKPPATESDHDDRRAAASASRQGGLAQAVYRLYRILPSQHSRRRDRGDMAQPHPPPTGFSHQLSVSLPTPPT